MHTLEFQPLEEQAKQITLVAPLNKSRKLLNIARNPKRTQRETEMLEAANNFILMLTQNTPVGVALPAGVIIDVMEKAFDLSSLEKGAFAGLLAHQIVCICLLSFVAAQVPWAHNTFIAFIPSEIAANFRDYCKGELTAKAALKMTLTTTQLAGIAWACIVAFPGITPENAPRVWAPFGYALATRVIKGIVDLKGWYKAKAEVDQFFAALPDAVKDAPDMLKLQEVIKTHMNQQWWHLVGGIAAPTLFGTTVMGLFVPALSVLNPAAPIATAGVVGALAVYGIYTQTCPPANKLLTDSVSHSVDNSV